MSVSDQPIAAKLGSGAKPLADVYNYFDLMRFVAATMVLVSHVRDLIFCDFADATAHGPLVKLFYFVSGLGHEAVVVFFVLSGFWISSSIDRRQQDPALWRHYVIDRLARLYVVLIPALALTFLWDIVGIYGLHGALYGGASGAHSLQTPVIDRLGLWTLLGNLGFLQTIVVVVFGSNGPLWSLANEFWYYVAYPGLFLLIRRRQWSLWLLAVPLVLALPDLRVGFGVWLMGVGLHYATRNDGVMPDRSWRNVAMLVGSCALTLVALALSRSGILGAKPADIVLGLAFTASLWALMQVRPRFSKLLLPLARYGSQASFSLYLSHFPLVTLVATILLSGARHQPGLVAYFYCGVMVLGALVYGRGFASMTEDRTGALRAWLRAKFA